MSTRPIEIPAMERASVVACVVPASTTASAWVEPWVISVGSETFASLRPPIEVALAPEAGHCGLDAALAVASGRSVEELRGRRLHERRIPLESVQLLEYIRESVGRRMVVQWFDASGPVARTDVRDGAHLVDLLTDPAHRHLDHVIGFPNGWYVDGLPWLL